MCASKFSRSYQLLKASLRVLRREKEIMLFPITAAAIIIPMLVSLVFVFYFSENPEFEFFRHNYMYFIPAFYFVSYFVGVFFEAGLMTVAYIRLNGGDPTFREGIENALKHIGKLFLWSMIAATVGLFLRISFRGGGLMGSIVKEAIGIAWELLTFFVTPMLIFENKGLIDSIKSSGHLFKRTWGESIFGEISIGLVFLVLSFAGILPLIVGLAFESFPIRIMLTSVTLVYWLALGAIFISINGVFRIGLYIYASTGRVPTALAIDFKSSFGLVQPFFVTGVKLDVSDTGAAVSFSVKNTGKVPVTIDSVKVRDTHVLSFEPFTLQLDESVMVGYMLPAGVLTRADVGTEATVSVSAGQITEVLTVIIREAYFPSNSFV